MNYCYRALRDGLERVRFDTVAGATQLFTEEMLVNWVKACVKKTGISDIVAGGGVFMNVKANMLIANLPEVTSFYVMPSAADESLSIGACLHHYYSGSDKTDHRKSVFENLYLGGEFSKKDEEKAIAAKCGGEFEIRELNDVDGAVAELLAQGQIVARSRGRMEWGARALGNRSILVSGHDYRVVDELNRAIKQRDFWMPFAPSLRAESAPRYLDDPKDIRPDFMTHTFVTNAEGRDHLSAGTHPRDHTIRAQVVTKKANPDYHRLLGLFEEKTGRGGLVNTSFNLHGEPIVHSPEDAIRVLRKSGLNHLALGHFVISKTKPTIQ
jgi:carbamoyltransferase